MVDNRSAGLLGIGGNINFKSGDISGTAAKTADDRASQGTEYFATQQEEQQNQEGKYIDRSMQLRASLNSLAMMNVAAVLNKKLRPKAVLEQMQNEEETPAHDKKINPVDSDGKNNGSDNKNKQDGQDETPPENE